MIDSSKLLGTTGQKILSGGQQAIKSLASHISKGANTIGTIGNQILKIDTPPQDESSFPKTQEAPSLDPSKVDIKTPVLETPQAPAIRLNATDLVHGLTVLHTNIVNYLTTINKNNLATYHYVQAKLKSQDSTFVSMQQKTSALEKQYSSLDLKLNELQRKLNSRDLKKTEPNLISSQKTDDPKKGGLGGLGLGLGSGLGGLGGGLAGELEGGLAGLALAGGARALLGGILRSLIPIFGFYEAFKHGKQIGRGLDDLMNSFPQGKAMEDWYKKNYGGTGGLDKQIFGSGGPKPRDPLLGPKNDNSNGGHWYNPYTWWDDIKQAYKESHKTLTNKPPPDYDKNYDAIGRPRINNQIYDWKDRVPLLRKYKDWRDNTNYDPHSGEPLNRSVNDVYNTVFGADAYDKYKAEHPNPYENIPAGSYGPPNTKYISSHDLLSEMQDITGVGYMTPGGPMRLGPGMRSQPGLKLPSGTAPTAGQVMQQMQGGANKPQGMFGMMRQHIDQTHPNSPILNGKDATGKPIDGQTLSSLHELAKSGNPNALHAFMRSKGYQVAAMDCGNYVSAVVQAAGGVPVKGAAMGSSWMNWGHGISGSDINAKGGQFGSMVASRMTSRFGGRAIPGTPGGHAGVIVPGSYDPKTNTFLMTQDDPAREVRVSAKQYAMRGANQQVAENGQLPANSQPDAGPQPVPFNNRIAPSRQGQQQGQQQRESLDRSRFAKELQQKPWLRDKVMRIAANEQGSHPQGTQAVIESMMNRAAMRGTSLEEQARWHESEHGYYQQGNMGRGALENPQHRKILETSLNNALSGGNISNYATDNASQGLAAKERASGAFRYRSSYTGETFFSPGSKEPQLARKYDAWLAEQGSGKPPTGNDVIQAQQQTPQTHSRWSKNDVEVQKVGWFDRLENRVNRLGGDAPYPKGYQPDHWTTEEVQRAIGMNPDKHKISNKLRKHPHLDHGVYHPDQDRPHIQKAGWFTGAKNWIEAKTGIWNYDKQGDKPPPHWTAKDLLGHESDFARARSAHDHARAARQQAAKEPSIWERGYNAIKKAGKAIIDTQGDAERPNTEAAVGQAKEPPTELPPHWTVGDVNKAVTGSPSMLHRMKDWAHHAVGILGQGTGAEQGGAAIAPSTKVPDHWTVHDINKAIHHSGLPPAPKPEHPMGGTTYKHNGEPINKVPLPPGHAQKYKDSTGTNPPPPGKPQASNPKYNPEQSAQQPGDKGYGDQRDSDNIGICSI